jgi:hypothetical protein
MQSFSLSQARDIKVLFVFRRTWRFRKRHSLSLSARGRQLGRFSFYSSHISVSRISIAKLIVHRPLNMDPILNIEIPFVLPGRKEVLDLKKVWPKEARETRPLQEVINSLRKQCPDINVHISVSEEQPTRDTG